MKLKKYTTCFYALILLCVFSLNVQAQDEDMTLDEALDALSSYQMNESRIAVTVVHEHAIRALNDKSVTPRLERRLVGILKSADSTNDAKAMVCRELALIGTDVCVPALKRLLLNAEMSDMARYALEAIPHQSALTVLEKSLQDVSSDLQPGIQASIDRRNNAISKLAHTGTPEDVIYLLELSSDGNDLATTTLAQMRIEGADKALNDATNDERQAVRALAVELLGRRGSTDFRSTIQKLAKRDASSTVRTVANLAMAEMLDWKNAGSRGKWLVSAMKESDLAVDKRKVLAAIAAHADPILLPVAQQEMESDVVGTDAALVVITLAMAMEKDNRDNAKQAVLEVMNEFSDVSEVREAAGNAIAQMEKNEGFITKWSISGPYTKEGVGTGDLLDIEFSPELAVDESKIKWQRVDAKDIFDPGIVDIKKVLGGDNRIAYLKTIIVSRSTQDIRLEVGSDDGVKVWLNDKVIHSNNVMRGLSINQDVVNAELKEGENVLILKIMQGGGDWRAACRIRTAEGFKPKGVQVKRPE